MDLVDISTGENVLSRPVKAITSYNVLGSQFTTRVSENDAREAALEDLARQIETQIALYLKR
jgi:LPS-assembly lipoprotein